VRMHVPVCVCARVCLGVSCLWSGAVGAQWLSVVVYIAGISCAVQHAGLCALQLSVEAQHA